MSAHATCSHAKTKAARSACRAGKAVPDAPSATDASPRDRLREKAAAASSKISEPKAEGEPGTSYRTEDGFIRGGNISGTCGIGAHDRCRGGGKQWFCTCDCHNPPSEA